LAFIRRGGVNQACCTVQTKIVRQPVHFIFL
jgi:hypothetical protein